MFTFSVVRKIGEGSYLNEAHFIIERIRRERALNAQCVNLNNSKNKSKNHGKDGKPKSS